MNEHENVATKLLRSVAVRSLQAEQEVADLLSNADWSADHGHVYKDPDTGKIREIDVFAYRDHSRSRRQRTQSVGLRVLVEVKSIREFHLVFAPRLTVEEMLRYVLGDSDAGNYEWIGWHEGALASALDTATAAPADVASTIRLFRRACFNKSGGMRASEMLLPPPEIQYRSSAFRETNVGTEKDVDASVLWRALLTLDSAVAAEKIDTIRAQVDQIARKASAASLLQESMTDAAEEDILDCVGFVAVYHPIVVVESRLWMSVGGELKEIQNCRFFRRDGDQPDRWYDVVTLSSFPAFVSELTSHYDAQLRKRGLR
jgi:hypothetical protein